MPDLRHCALQLLTFSSILIFASADTACNESTTELQDYQRTGYVLYCFKNQIFKWSNKIVSEDLCHSYNHYARVKLIDIEILIFAAGGTPCKLSKLGYKKQKNGSCFQPLVKPFLEKFSGEPLSLDQTRLPNLTVYTGKDQGNIISYKFECIEDSNTIDMCRHNTSFHEGDSTLQMLFNQENLGTSSNCYCSVVSANINSVTARALDIRLNYGNQLLFDSYQLPTKDFYWWRDGDLRSGFSNVRLMNLQSEAPPSVWMDINGVNLTITCDNKPLDSAGDTDSHSSSSAGGFGIIHIIGIIVGCVILLTLMFLMARCLQRQNNKRRDDLSMEDYDVAERISNRSTNHPERETLIASQLEEEYPKQSNYDDGRPDEEIELYDKPRIYKPIQDESNENQVTNNNQSSDISRDSSIESSSKENHSDDNATNTAPNIYSHLGDKPDIVPSSSSNIYDAMGKDDYSALERQPKTVTTDTLYDVA